LKKNLILNILLLTLIFALLPPLFANPEMLKDAQEAFSAPNSRPQNDLYKNSRQAIATGNIAAARLYALRLFFDGSRNPNLLNLLALIELEDRNVLMAAEWFRKAESLSKRNQVATRYLSRLPSEPTAIPVNPAELPQHLYDIAASLPKLTQALSNSKLHKETMLKAIERGQLYLALALSEEFEKKYPSPEASGLTAMCAYYLGRNADALQTAKAALSQDPYEPYALFAKAMIEDTHPASSVGNYMNALYYLDRWQEVLSEVDNYNTSNPRSAGGYIAKARIMLEMHNIEGAAEALQQAGIREPGNPEIDLLWVSYLLQRDEPEKASRRLENAMKRGYNIPSVYLTAALFAIQSGKYQEARMIIDDMPSYLPFNDLEAYPLYVTTLIIARDMTKAQEVLAIWRAKAGERSMYCYISALYNFSLGNNTEAIKWLEKGFEQNPDRIDILKVLSEFPAMALNQELYAKISSKLNSVIFSGSSVYKSSPAIDLPDFEAKKKQTEQQLSNQPPIQQASVAGQPLIKFPDEMSQANIDYFHREISTACANIEHILKTGKNISAEVVTKERYGPTIVLYDAAAHKIIVSENYRDYGMIKSFLLSIYPDATETHLSETTSLYPGHLLMVASARALLREKFPEMKNNDTSNWLALGLAQILSEHPKPLSHTLLAANHSIKTSQSAFLSEEKLNKAILSRYSSPADIAVEEAQSYLMTAWLMKQSNKNEGTANILKLMQANLKGEPFEKSLQQIFKVDRKTFDKSWREAAEWCLSEGKPYQW